VSNVMDFFIEILQNDINVVRGIENAEDVFQLQLRLCETWRNDETVLIASQRALLWLIKSGMVDQHVFKYPQTFNEIIEFSKLAKTTEEVELSFETVKYLASRGTMAKEFISTFLGVFHMEDFSSMTQTEDIRIKEITFGLVSHLTDRKIITRKDYIVEDDDRAFSVLQQQEEHVKSLWDAGVHRGIESTKSTFKRNVSLAQNCGMLMEAFSFNCMSHLNVSSFSPLTWIHLTFLMVVLPKPLCGW
jgi:hypothetical protein